MIKLKWLFVLLLISACSAQQEEIQQESIVYLKSKDGNFDLFKIDVLGQWEERLTTNPGWDWYANWNAELNKLVYYTNDTLRNFSVVAMGLNEAKVDTLPNSDLLNFKLTPDAKRIVYVVQDGEARNIWWCNLDGSDKEALTKTESYNGRAALSPDGESMAFISDRSGSNELYVMDLESKKVSRLTENNLVEKYISWSPDSQQIAVTMREDTEDSKEDIFIMNVDGSNLYQLTNTPYAEQEIAWSLSGKKIAFHGTTENDGDQIYTIDLADGKFTKITSGDYYHGEPAWIPGN